MQLEICSEIFALLLRDAEESKFETGGDFLTMASQVLGHQGGSGKVLLYKDQVSNSHDDWEMPRAR